MVNLKNEHEDYRKNFQDQQFRKEIIENDIIHRNSLKALDIRKDLDDKVLDIFDNLLDKFTNTEYYFYAYHFPQNDSPSYIFITKQFDALLQVRLCGGTHDSYLNNLIRDHTIIIEVEALHSFKKGKGKIAINLLKEVSNKIKIPLYLYDNNLKDRNYYQNLDFINTSSKGINDEPLLVYVP